MTIKIAVWLKSLFLISLSLISILAIADCSQSNSQCEASIPQVSITSLSSDGRYAITVNEFHQAVLWNIKDKTKKIISENANPFSAYFIKHTPYYMWQDLKGIVHIQDIEGKEILFFHNFTTYGQVMTSDLKHYFAADQDWKLYAGYSKSQRKIDAGYLGGGEKMLNLTLSNDNKLLLTSGEGGSWYADTPLSAPKGKINLNLVTLWDVDSGKPLCKFAGNIAKTIATLSPDAKYIVSVDEDMGGFVWETRTGKKLLELWSLWLGKPIKWNEYKVVTEFDTTGLIQPPADFLEDDPHYIIKNEDMFATKFIDLKGHYLNFYTYIPSYTVLYHINDGRPIKYLKLGASPKPLVEHYMYDQTIDTAPEANILVMAQHDASGIIVYKYHPDTQELEKIWAPT